MVGQDGANDMSKKKKQKQKKPFVTAEATVLEAFRDPEFRLQRGTSSYGVQPLGNLLYAESLHNVRDAGLGSLNLLSDELLLDILGLLTAEELGKLALVSKSFYVFVHQDSLWRNLVLDEFRGGFVYKGRWKNTYISTAYPQFKGPMHIPLKANLLQLMAFCVEDGEYSLAHLEFIETCWGLNQGFVSGFYSDHMFQSWLCASLEMRKEWLSRDNIPRRSNITLEEFVRDFEEPNKPVLLTGALDHWPALSKWDREYLLLHAGEVPFSCGPVNMKLKDYYQYADLVEEERPLYIFDSKFADKARQLGDDYDTPVYFREDLFSVLEDSRPDYRWLILGPARSGSSFHIDPNSTSAWNAVIRGSKKWIMYPPDVVPPGVFPSPDGAEVASPVSLAEWFMNFYEETRRRKQKPVECVCKAGELVFVPNGWWHIVINLEESIAITQNYVSRSNLLNVLDFLNKPNSKELVSGTVERETLYDRFLKAYEKSYPGSLQKLRLDAQERAKRAEQKSFWDTVADTKQGGGFKFGF